MCIEEGIIQGKLSVSIKNGNAHMLHCNNFFLETYYSETHMCTKICACIKITITALFVIAKKFEQIQVHQEFKYIMTQNAI